LGLALYRIHRALYALMLVGLAGLLLPGILSEYAPHFHRVLAAAAPAALLCGLGLDWLWLQASRLQWGAMRVGRLVAPALVLLLLLDGGINSAQAYFGRWAGRTDLYYAFDQGLWELGQWANRQPLEEPIYLSPRSPEHPTLAFAWRNRSQSLITSFDGRHIFPLTAAENPVVEHYAIIEDEDFRSRLLLPDLFPSLVVSHEFFDPGGRLYARIYSRPPGTPLARQPHISLPVVLGDGIELAGYDVQPAILRRGEVLYLQLHWQVTATPQESWTVFTHLFVRESGVTVSGSDSPPGQETLPTRQWQPGWRILDEYQIPIPVDLPPGEYGLRFGLYTGAGNRLPAATDGLILHDVTIE
jgi:hypothetical protein